MAGGKCRTKFTAGDIFFFFFRRDFRLSTMVSRKMVGIIMYNLYCHDATFTSEPTTPEVIDRDDHKRYSNNIYLYSHRFGPVIMKLIARLIVSQYL